MATEPDYRWIKKTYLDKSKQLLNKYYKET